MEFMKKALVQTMRKLKSKNKVLTCFVDCGILCPVPLRRLTSVKGD